MQHLQNTQYKHPIPQCWRTCTRARAHTHIHTQPMHMHVETALPYLVVLDDFEADQCPCCCVQCLYSLAECSTAQEVHHLNAAGRQQMWDGIAAIAPQSAGLVSTQHSLCTTTLPGAAPGATTSVHACHSMHRCSNAQPCNGAGLTVRNVAPFIKAQTQ